MAHILQLTLLQRKPGLSREQFQRYWREVHAPLVRRLPHVVSYTQHHVTAGSTREGYPAPDLEIDGIVEFVFDSAEGARSAFSGPSGRDALSDAEKLYRDNGRPDRDQPPGHQKPRRNASGSPGMTRSYCCATRCFAALWHETTRTSVRALS